MSPDEVRQARLRPFYVTIEFTLWGMVGREMVEIFPWLDEHPSHIAFRAGVFFGSQLPKKAGATMVMVRIANFKDAQ